VGIVGSVSAVVVVLRRRAERVRLVTAFLPALRVGVLVSVGRRTCPYISSEVSPKGAVGLSILLPVRWYGRERAAWQPGSACSMRVDAVYA
jgi:hypothetical protein